MCLICLLTESTNSGLYLQVDYEAVKYENRRLKEDVDDMNTELEELAKLKKIVENNLEEALATIVQEREQKHAIKKELDQRLKTDSLYALQSLVNFGLADGRRVHDSSEDSPALKKIEGEFSLGDGAAVTTVGSPTSTIPETRSVVGDLFSEIHVTEVRKLEKLLEDVEIEKSELQTMVDEMRERLRLAEEELGARDETIEQLKMQLVNSTAAQPTAGEVNPQEQMGYIRRQGETDGEADADDGVSKLRRDSASAEESTIRLATEQESRIRRLEADLTVMSQLASESQSTLSSTQDSLVQVTEEIASLYHLVCEVNGETPNRLTLEHVRSVGSGKHVSRLKTRDPSQAGSFVSGEEGQPVESTDTAKEQPLNSLTETRGSDPTHINDSSVSGEQRMPAAESAMGKEQQPENKEASSCIFFISLYIGSNLSTVYLQTIDGP